MVNFRQPYLATSLQDFWRRWHISLSTWLRDYLYIPLGGNRHGDRKTYRNLLLTMLFGGLWHGANWTFVVWGGIHGSILVIERGVWQLLSMTDATGPAADEIRAPLFRIGTWVRRILIFHVVCLAWVFFRALSVNDAFRFLTGVASFSWKPEYLIAFKFLAFFAVPLFCIDLVNEYRNEEYLFERIPESRRIAVAAVLFLWLACFSGNELVNSYIFDFSLISCSRPGLRPSLALGLLLVFLSMALELVCRLAVPRISRVERRLVEEYEAAMESGRPPVAGLQVLVVGNSLLNSGIRFDEAHRSLLPEIDARRWMVLDTGYSDWYYGMRRLFGGGSRPGLVVLILTPRQLVGSEVPGNYFGYHLMSMTDLFSVATDLKLSNTQTSNLAFANLSASFGLGYGTRKWLARQVFQDLPRLTSLMAATKPAPLLEEQVYSTSLRRLRALRELSAQYRESRPGYPAHRSEGVGGEVSEARVNAVQRAGSSAGVSVLVPLALGSLQADCYSDNGFHLNERGARIFTPLFVEAVRKELGDARRDRTKPAYTD